MFDSLTVGHPARRDASRGGPSVLSCSHTRSGVVDHLGIGTDGRQRSPPWTTRLGEAQTVPRSDEKYE